MFLKLCSLFTAAVFCVSAQQLDFSSLDKLASKASSVNRVSLNQDQLKAALSMLSGMDKNMDRNSRKNMDGLREMTQNLTGVEVRSFEFDKPGQYKDSDLAAIRQQLGTLKEWSKIIDSKEDGEHSEIYMRTENGKNAGLAVIAAEETEVSVVILKGPASLKDLGSLGGLAGLPSIQMGPRSDPPKKD